ncbi:MAG: TrpB-like pyridoxal phosphate-dependent enzyme [Coriobacteriales bacterium]|jgi:tryptophan synthase beta chain|nr:TrpB-like pyridoxal phosphate-dependent enzyme [Coriobacteriales bacterium]
MSSSSSSVTGSTDTGGTGGGAVSTSAIPTGGGLSAKTDPYKVYLAEDEIPTAFYNVRADMQTGHAPILHPGTLQPVTVADIEPVFCTKLAEQELNDRDRFIDIPGSVLDFYRMYRPSPLVRAYYLEQALDTPARIYYKYEGGNTSGSHKLNSAIAQAFYAKEQGLSGLTTETGAGQWGTAMSMACVYFGLDLDVYMVKVSFQQKPYRKTIMKTYGANIFASPSDTTEVGRRMLATDPDSLGSLGTAISEAVEVAVGSGGKRRYVLGSVLNQVLIHQSIIGLEAKAAMDRLEAYPDVVIGSAGGGSNLGGLMAPYMAERLAGKAAPRFIAVEPASCPSLTRGRFAYDFCDAGEVTPLAKMYTLGHAFMPAANHAGGLRYHGMSPILSQLYHDGYLDEARAVEQTAVFEAAVQFARTEGTLPAPESAHAIRVAIDEAIAAREAGEARTILFGLTGNGSLDLGAYEQYLDGTMTDYIPTDADLERGFASIPCLPGIQ